MTSSTWRLAAALTATAAVLLSGTVSRPTRTLAGAAHPDAAIKVTPTPSPPSTYGPLGAPQPSCLAAEPAAPAQPTAAQPAAVTGPAVPVPELTSGPEAGAPLDARRPRRGDHPRPKPTRPGCPHR